MPLDNEMLFNKIRLFSNRLRFKILELTQNKRLTISQLSSMLKLSYTKCADYITLMEKQRLVSKEKYGKEVKIKSIIKIENISKIFS